ncbi:MAG: RnfABCDGE type electron transport complex subunit C [Candidatus Omnitrophota bacterium]
MPVWKAQRDFSGAHPDRQDRGKFFRRYPSPLARKEPPLSQRSQNLSIEAERKLGPSKSPFEKRNKRLGRKAIGIRLERKKDASLLSWNLKRPYPPEKIRIPVPAFAEPCVKTGQMVQTGQKIAEPQGLEGVSLYAGMPGTVEKIAVFPSATGSGKRMIEIRKHGEPKALPSAETHKGWDEIPAEELPKIFQRSGLVTTDSVMEPVHTKLGRYTGARTVIINGCEPEPYVTCEQTLIMSHSLEILKGAELLKKTLGAEKIFFVLESCNLEMIELIKSKIYFLKWEHVEVQTVPALYPQGLESTLLRAWFPGTEEEAVVFPASTAFAVYEAVVQQKPFYERVVTVGGECVVEPRSLWLPIGISFHDALHACKGVMREPRKILMGGPMAGEAQTTTEVPVMAGTNAILALPGEVVKEEAEMPCIRCNLCVDHCPVSLSPAMITLAAEQKELATAEEWNVRECIECGNCAYVCPSKRPMLKLIRSVRVLSNPAVAHG